MLIEITSNQGKVLRHLVERMTVADFPMLDAADFEDAWAVLRTIEAAHEPPKLRTRIAFACRVLFNPSG